MTDGEDAERRREACRRFYAKHRERLCEEQRRRRAANPEKVREKNRKYYSTHALRVQMSRKRREEREDA